MVVNFIGIEMRIKVESVKVKFGQCCFVGYFFFQEVKIVGVFDEFFDYVFDGNGQVVIFYYGYCEIEEFGKKVNKIENFYSKCMGILIGFVEFLVRV